ncbi:MAG: HlyD family efflux transporter periplasmic adaptor subunit [Pseudomonadota bacterium]
MGAIIAIVAFAAGSFRGVSLARSDVLIATVEFGDLDVVVEGFGVLRSSKQQILASLTTATVQEIVLKPGAPVSPGSVIARLSNPDVQREVETARQELAQAEANLRQMLVTHKREILDEEAGLAELESRHEIARLRREAEEQLVDAGIISRLAFKESLANESQLRQRIDVSRERMQQLSVVHSEAITSQRELVKQSQGKLDSARAREDSLTVVSSLEGVVQRLDVELGQSVQAGQEVALIGSSTDLVALIRVPQSRASQVSIGQAATVDIRSDRVAGRVTRVEPRVDENTVLVEIVLPGDLPEGAIAEQNVDAAITVESIDGAHYIRRPANVRPHSEIDLYRLDSDSSLAQRVAIVLGKESGRSIQIVSGAQEGERYIISDMSNYEASKISIN